MTKGEINLLCAEVDKLLNDICKFLNEEIDGGYLSENGRRIATKLIERSKKQLHTISMTINPDSSGPYVDMRPYKVNSCEKFRDSQDMYSNPEMYEGNFTPSIEGQSIGPYLSLPAYKVKASKAGFLYKKEKILFFEQQRKIFAAIHQSWFLIYLNETATNPVQTFDLSRYDVRPLTISQKDNKRWEESFELISSEESKTYQFTAQTSKDMHQWVASLKLHIESLVTMRNLPSVPAKKMENDFVDLSEPNNDYEPIKPFSVKKENKSTNEEIADPPLPPRNTGLKQVPITQQYIPKASSSDSVNSTYDPVGPAQLHNSREASNSFSEDDSDRDYDNPSELRKNNFLPPVKQYDNTQIDDDEDDIYDSLEISSFHLKPKVVVTPTSYKNLQDEIKHEIKPKPMIKAKLLSLRSRKKNGV